MPNKMTLVVLAAGMGTRFGTRIKQLEKLGPDGELLIDYSVYDAINAGFDRVVFIIRRDIEELFKSTIGKRVEKRIRTDYVFQSTDQLPVRCGDFPTAQDHGEPRRRSGAAAMCSTSRSR